MSNFSGFIESKEDADRQIGAVAMKMPISRLGLFAMKMPICRLGLFTKKMPEASDNGSQPYSCPLGDCEPKVTVRVREGK